MTTVDDKKVVHIPDDKVIFVGISGSLLYGTPTGDSDVDYRGVFAEPYESLLDPFNTLRAVDHWKGYDDAVLYSTTRFIQLLSQNNPNIMEMLFIPEDKVVVGSKLWKEHIVANIPLFLSKRISGTFGGYARQEFRNATEAGAWIPVGYDPKSASHSIRILLQGIELATTGMIQFPLIDAQFIHSIKLGQVKKDELIKFFTKKHKEFQDAVSRTDWPLDVDLMFMAHLSRKLWLNSELKELLLLSTIYR